MGNQYDAVVVGAGFAGMYMLKMLRDKLGMKVKVIERAANVGGTWHWNRYPGARVDSAAYVYCYTWDEELWKNWKWTERFPKQPEILKYLEHVAERHDLNKDIDFNTSVVGANYDEEQNQWSVKTDKGETFTAQYFITGVGTLTASYNIPKFKGLDKFKGKWYHTSTYPHEGVDFLTKRVGVVGTGATAVQAIPMISRQAKEVVVFQRTANFCIPARNGQVDPEVVAKRKTDYKGIVERCRSSAFGHEYWFKEESALSVSKEEREAEFEKMWAEGGFAFWVGNYIDILASEESNELCCEFIRKKIKDIVHDPITAEKLTPKTHAFGSKRVPLETDYFDTFNKKNVTLIDAEMDGGIEEITENGIIAGGKEYPLDIIIFATGFDAITGPLKALNITGRNGQTLVDKWDEGPKTYLGVSVEGFPNMFTITGPQSPSVLSNMPVSIEQHVEWITDCIEMMRKEGKTKIEPTVEAEEHWVDHVNEAVGKTLMTKANSWYMSANIPGKARAFLPYLRPDGVGGYRKECQEIADEGYKGFELS